MSSETILAAEMILQSRRLFAFAGAGLSQESGIPVFRGDEGIWKEYLPIIYGNPAGLISALIFSPGRFRDFVVSALEAFLKAEPNPGHLALAELSCAGLLKAVITQNIDDLEQRAGVKEVVQLHGSIYRMRCVSCQKTWNMMREQLLQALEELKQSRSRGDMIELGRRFGRCPYCTGRGRPDIVFFGESLDQESYYRAVELARSSDLVMVLGTSAVVYPVAMIPSYARKAGAKIIEINPKPGKISRFSEIVIRRTCASALPEIVAEIKKLSPELFQPVSGP